MSSLNLDVTKRDVNVRNVFRKSILNNFIPGVLYNNKENHPISIPRDSFEKQFSKVRSNTIFNLKLDGNDCKAYIKEYTTSLTQTNQIKHIDFYKMVPGSSIQIKVPIQIKGLAKGIAKGGYIENYSWELKVICDPNKIPETIEIDISKLDIGERICVADLTKIDGLDFLESPDRSIVGVMISSKTVSDASAGDSTPTEEEPKKEKS